MIKRRLCILLAAGLLYAGMAFCCSDYMDINYVDVDQGSYATTWSVRIKDFDPTDMNFALFTECLNALPSAGMKSVIVFNPIDHTVREFNSWPLIVGNEADLDCEECYEDEEI